MNLKFANTALFEINTQAEVKVEEIGKWKSKVITIDDVFRYPDEMRDWCSTHPLERSRSWYPGWQQWLEYPFDPITRYQRLLLTEHHGIYNSQFCWNVSVINSKTKCLKRSLYPHSDTTHMAFNYCLNHDEEITDKDGTAFYRVKETGEEAVFRNPSIYRKEKYADVLPENDHLYKQLVEFEGFDGDERYELYHFLPRKFNRLHIYEGALFHSAYFKKGMYTDTFRMNFQSFC